MTSCNNGGHTYNVCVRARMCVQVCGLASDQTLAEFWQGLVLRSTWLFDYRKSSSASLIGCHLRQATTMHMHNIAVICFRSGRSPLFKPYFFSVAPQKFLNLTHILLLCSSPLLVPSFWLPPRAPHCPHPLRGSTTLHSLSQPPSCLSITKVLSLSKTTLIPSPTYFLQRGIRQGCPLSLYFIVVSSALTADFHSMVETLFNYCPWTFPANLSLPDVEYADDTVLMSRSRETLHRLLHLLLFLASQLGLILNGGKCQLIL